MQHVFISYKHEDQDFAENLMGRLEKAGFQIWSDYKIGAGEEWRTAIDLAIKNAFALIVIMTPEAKASEYVTYEWAFAWGIGIKVVPIMLRATQLHPRLEALQYLDFTNRNRPWEKLIEELNAAAHAPLAHTINIPLNSPPYVRQAVIALDSANRNDRLEAIYTLASVNHPETPKVLIEASRHPIGDVRREATRILGQIKDPAAVPALSEALHDRSSEIRRVAAYSLGEIKDPAAIPALAEALHDDNLEVCREAIVALGKTEDPAAIPALAEALHDDNLEVHREVVVALEKIKDPAAIPALAEALHDDSPIVTRELPQP